MLTENELEYDGDCVKCDADQMYAFVRLNVTGGHSPS